MDKRLAVKFPREAGKGWRGFLPPVGILKAEFHEAAPAGCIQATMSVYFDGLMKVTKYNPCNGCPAWKAKGPTCECFQQYHSAFRAAKAKITAEEASQKELHTRVIERCTDCGLRVRGPNHKEGKHHLQRIAALNKI